jgi:hypothetical protein
MLSHRAKPGRACASGLFALRLNLIRNPIVLIQDVHKLSRIEDLAANLALNKLNVILASDDADLGMFARFGHKGRSLKKVCPCPSLLSIANFKTLIAAPALRPDSQGLFYELMQHRDHTLMQDSYHQYACVIRVVEDHVGSLFNSPQSVANRVALPAQGRILSDPLAPSFKFNQI